MKTVKILLVLFTALLIFSGKAVATTVSIPDVTGDAAAAYDIPVNIDNAAGIAGYQFDVTYDPAVLDCTTVLKGSLTVAWDIPTVNATVAGVINFLSLDPNLTALSGGSGSLALIRCTVVGVSGATTLSFTPSPNSILMDSETNEVPATLVDGSFTITGDGTPPDTSITSHPKAVSNKTSADFGFTSTEEGSTFQCKLDDGVYTDCTSPRNYADLAEGPHTFSVKATDGAGNPDATPAAFTWKIDTTAPTLGALTPVFIVTEQGKAQKFTAVYSDTAGYTNLRIVELLVTPNGSMSGSIRAAYNRQLNKLYLYNDAGTEFVAGNCIPGGAGTLSNSQGTLNCGTTKRTVSGNDFTLNWNITPGASFTGVKQVKMKAVDAAGNTASFAKEGTWTIIAANTKPVLQTLTPANLTSAAGTARNLTAVYSDADGQANLKTVELLVTTSGSTAAAILAKYDRTAKKLSLYNDSGTSAIGSCSPGEATILTNAQGSLDCSATTVSASGQDLTVVWNIKPKPAFTGAQQMKMKATDNSNATVGWVKKGTWTIQ
jgi:hypothetical protein